MLKNTTLAALILSGGLLAEEPARAQIPVFPIDKVRPGLRGTALTVLEGTEPDSLPVEVIGVYPGNSPGSHIILVRGHGELTRTGIAHGMSGSPVFVNGKLVGALAFSFPGAKEAIGGVIPFAEMKTALEDAFVASGQPRGTSAGEMGGGIRLDLCPFPEWRDLCGQSRQAPASPGSGARGQELPVGLSRIGLPVLIDGGPAAAMETLEPILRAAGLHPLPCGTVSSQAALRSRGEAETPPSESPGGQGEQPELRPGDALGINLISGDMNIAAIGTVTWVEGDNVYALGHPFLFSGSTEMPVSKARIHTIVPTLSMSFKVGTPLQEVGALVADKRTGVAAVLGRHANQIPLDVTIQAADPAGGAEEFHFRVARHELLTPSLLSAAIGLVLIDREYALGLSTLAAEIAIGLEDGRTLRRRDLFRTLRPAQTIAAEVMAPVNYLIAGTFSTFPVRSVSVKLRLVPALLAAEVERIQVPKNSVRPGEKLPVEIRLRQHRRGDEIRNVVLQVPEAIRGEELLILAGCARSFFEWDKDRAPGKYRPRSLDDLVRLMEEYPSDESLIVRLYGPSRGVVLRGREIPSLPLSKWQALSKTSTGGATAPVGGVILDEVILETGEVILGGTSVRIRLEQ